MDHFRGAGHRQKVIRSGQAKVALNMSDLRRHWENIRSTVFPAVVATLNL